MFLVFTVQIKCSVTEVQLFDFVHQLTSVIVAVDDDGDSCSKFLQGLKNVDQTKFIVKCFFSDFIELLLINVLQLVRVGFASEAVIASHFYDAVASKFLVKVGFSKVHLKLGLHAVRLPNEEQGSYELSFYNFFVDELRNKFKNN